MTVPSSARNPLGVHALVWTQTWTPETIERAFAGTRAAGYDILEVPLLDPWSAPVEELRAAAERHGLRLTCSLGLGFDADISSDDPEVAARGARLLDAALDATVALGSDYLGGVVYSALGKYLRPHGARGHENLLAALRALAVRASDAGVTIGLESVNRYESNVINTVEQAIELIRELGVDGVVAHLDLYHMNIEESDIGHAVKVAADAGLLGYVHVGESNRGPLGTGRAPLDELCRALVDVGYEGPIVFESFSSAVVSPDFVAALAIWRDLWDDSDDLVRGAHARILESLAAAERGAR